MYTILTSVILKSCQYDAIVLVKGKGKIHPETGDEGPERERAEV